MKAQGGAKIRQTMPVYCSLEPYDRRAVNVLISQCYGCEDIQIKTGIPLETVREIIAEKRATGTLNLLPLNHEIRSGVTA